MTRTDRALPPLGDALFLTDSGLETTLVYQHGYELPCFAAFPLLADDQGRRILEGYYLDHAALATEAGLGFVLESPTWRASREWGAKLGWSESALADVNRAAIDLLVAIRDELGVERSQMPISGNVGPRRDGYVPDSELTRDEAEAYHREQVALFAQGAADLVSAFTLPSSEEAAGFARAAADLDVPAVVSFTVETDGRLPTGEPLAEAIEAVDAASAGWPRYYMLNCAHPSHFASTLEDAAWMRRIRGVRVNASTKSHAELDRSTELDAGHPVELGHETASLRQRFPWLSVLGGCCGTDLRHVRALRAAALGPRPGSSPIIDRCPVTSSGASGLR